MAETTSGAPLSEGERGAWAEIRRLLPYARPHRALFAATLAVSVALSVIDVPIPFFLKKVIDAGPYPKDKPKSRPSRSSRDTSQPDRQPDPSD